jgi:hypothetical protein
MKMKDRPKRILEVLEKFSFLVLIIHIIMWLFLFGTFIGGWLRIVINPTKTFTILNRIMDADKQYTGIGANPVWLSLSITALTVIMFSLRVFIVYLIYRFLKQITMYTIFNETNLQFIRLINYSFIGFIGLDVISTIIFKSVHSVGSALSNGHGLGFEILAWFVIYVIYVVFEYGLQIQKDNDAII